MTLRPVRGGLGSPPHSEYHEVERLRRSAGPGASGEGMRDPEAKVQLPAPPSPLIGRDRELRETHSILLRPEVRLVTLAGPPGVGKTRLALEVARAARPAFPDGVRFVDLSLLTDADQVMPVLAHSLRVAGGRKPLLEAVAQALGQRRVLLVLDTFEHVLDAAADVGALLDQAAGLKVLATGREPLRLRWEYVVAIGPLRVPELARLPAPRRLARVPAVALLVDRVRQASRQFRLTEANAEAIARICVHLDGLPLALELVAPAVKALGAQTVVERLDRRLSLLSRSARDLPPRHRTLRAAVGWSYGLLGPPEQLVFRRLSVLVGGWTLEMAAAVCDLPTGVVVDALSRLVDKNLVHRESSPGGGRFRMLETVREFAEEQLAASGELAGTYRRAAESFAELAERAEPALRGPQQKAWLDRLDAEYPNLRAALQWCCEAKEADTLCRLAAALLPLWNVRGSWQEGRRWISAALAQAEGVPPLRRARLLYSLAVLAWRLGESETAAAAVEQAAELAGRAGDPALSAHALRTAASVKRDRADVAGARELADQSLQLFREIQDPHGISSALRLVGFAALEWCAFPEAAEPFAESLQLARRLGDTRGVAWSLYGLAAVALAAGENEAGSVAEVTRADTLGRECLELFSELGDRNGVAQALTLLARVEVIRGDYGKAEARYREALAIRQELGNPADLASLLVELAVLAEVRGDDGGAARLFQKALGQFRHGAYPLGLAHAAEGLAILASQLHHPRTAARLLGFAGSLYEATGVTQSHLRIPGMPRLDQVREAEQEAQAALGQEGYAQAWAEGAAMPLEALAAEASTLTPTGARQGSGAGGLTPREQEVAALVAQGLSNREIAAQLGISERTVDSHVIHILNRLGFRSRAQVAAWVTEHHLIPSLR